MSSGWSYFSLSGPRRRTSVSLPRSNNGATHEELPARTPARHAHAHSMNDFRSGKMNQGQRLRYLKTGAITVFVLAVVYFVFLAPRSAAPTTTTGSTAGHGGGNTALPGAETQRCTTSVSKDKPLIQYAIMVDAGSTGSRIHVYKFNNCGPTPELEDEVFKMTEKAVGGLSAFDDDAEGAAKSLDPLLDVAVKSVPVGYQSCTPIAVKATAGLRKLGQQKSDATLAAVRARLETKYPFAVVAADKGGVEVMDGKDEGIYAWITANYLLGKIGGPDKSPTAAVLDLGGGSTQIVFEPTFKEAAHGGMPEKLAAGDHKYDLDFGGRHFELYQHSYLGYGLMEARNNLHSAVLNSFMMDHKEKENQSWMNQFKQKFQESYVCKGNREIENPCKDVPKDIINPCIAPGMKRNVSIELPADHVLGKTVVVNMAGPKEAAPALCRGFAEQTLEKDAECKIAPCAFRGIHQPSFEKTFSREDVYLFSYFYDRTKPLGMPESFSLKELKELTERVCAGQKAWDVFSSVEKATEELLDRPEWCLDLNFQLALLHTGYGMPIDREVKIAKKIKGNELGWCLGASLPLLNKESGWNCRIKEVPS